MKLSQNREITPLPPAYRELIDAIIDAACQYYTVTRNELVNERKMAHARQRCFYIISRSTTGVRDYDIGRFFNKKRTAVQYGIELIETHRRIYRQTLGDLNGIIGIANTFEKKYSWHLPWISTTG